MRVISRSKSALDVGNALDTLVSEINEELKSVDGVITKMDCDISLGPLGTNVNITLLVNGNHPRRKEIIGVNERGVNPEHSMKRATERLNKILESRSGEINDIFTQTIVTPLPGRVYTTIVVAINEDTIEAAQDAGMRRQRLKKTLEMLNNDPSAINVASVAQIFGVSRTMIYKDLEALGFKRTQLKEEEEQ